MLIAVSSSNRPLLLKSSSTTRRVFPSNVISPSRYAAAFSEADAYFIEPPE